VDGSVESCVIELIGILGKDIREWISRDLFARHIQQYCAHGRKAPVYWQLSTPSAFYSIWFYYHRLTKDTFYKALNDYVLPKLQHEERKLTVLTQSAGVNPSTNQRREIAQQEPIVEELRAFRDEIARIAPLWNPDLNDGVLINFAPLWRLVPQHRSWQKECKECWDKLVAGEYDWAHLTMHLWPERVVPKCMTDRSLAIAHGLEEVFWEEGVDGKWKLKKVGKDIIDRLIAERTSVSVKAALKSLLEAPAPSTGRGGARRSESPRLVAATARKQRETKPPSASGPSDAVVERVREAIASSDNGTSKAGVLAATGITNGQWNVAINALLAQGLVTKTGERRGARYHLAGGKNA
jgi:hypothetical protein